MRRQQSASILCSCGWSGVVTPCRAPCPACQARHVDRVDDLWLAALRAIAADPRARVVIFTRRRLVACRLVVAVGRANQEVGRTTGAPVPALHRQAVREQDLLLTERGRHVLDVARQLEQRRQYVAEAAARHA